MFEASGAAGRQKMMSIIRLYRRLQGSDIRQLVGIGVKMEHSICMFIKAIRKNSPPTTRALIEVAGVDNTILSSDLGCSARSVR